MAKAKQQYRSIKQRLFSMGNPVSGMRAFFNSESLETIQRYAERLSGEAFFRNAFVGKGYPTTISEIGHCGNMPLFSDLEKSLLWYTLSLRAEAEKINNFLMLKADFEKAFLSGTYDICLKLLDESNRLFGRSLWEIKKRIAVLNEKERLESQKKYSSSVISEFPKGSVFGYIINSYSKQCERNISIRAFYNMIDGDFARFTSNGVPVLLCKYAKFKAAGSISVTEEDALWSDYETINYILCFDDKCPIIDRYLSLRDIAASLYVCGKDKLFSRLLPYFKMLNTVISDPFLSNSCFLWEHNYCQFHELDNEQVCNVFDLYSRGEYETCTSLTKQLLLDKVTYFPLVEVYAKSNIYLAEYSPLSSTHTVMDTVARKLKQLLSRTGDIKDLHADLLKILYTHLDSNWAMELLLIIEKSFNKLTVLEETRMYSLYSSISTPEQIFSFDEAYLQAYLNDVTDNYKNSVTTQLAIAVRTKKPDQIDSLVMDPVRKQKYKAGLLLESDPEKALNLTSEILENGVIPAVYLEISALRVKALLHTQNLLDAIATFISAFFENSNFVHIGSIDSLFNDIKSGDYDVSGSILVPIICSIYFNYYPAHDDRDDIVLSVCYDEYLETLNVEKPSDLLNAPPDDVDEPTFIRFLAEVCVPSVMERSLAFATDDDILRERNVICEALVELDPDNREKYKEEIRRHTNTLLMRLAKREIETGKIYVDVDAIRMLLTQEICEPYERYLEHQKNDLDEQLFEILNQITSGEADNSIYLVRQVKQTEMLEEIVKKARDIFVADNKYGLDGCLSVRIRHGTLESQLRSCFEKHKLVTTKAVDGSYNTNAAWVNSAVASIDAKVQIDEIFSRFSQTIDTCIQKLKKELIQIQTESKNPKGLFDFTVNANLVGYVESKIYNLESYNQFERFIVELWMDTAELSLDKVRGFLVNEMNRMFQDALITLEKDVQIFHSVLNLQGLRDQIANARTDISAELKNIAEWFKLSQPDGFIDYNLSLATQISYSTFQHSHPSCLLQCNYDKIDTNIMLKGQTLRSVVDILIILLDNVMKHSAMDTNISANICATREQNNVVLTVSNPVKPGSVSSARLTEITDRLADWEKQGYTSREGGSGFHKIKKILSVDLQCPNHLEISCKEDLFCVRITADFKEAML